MSTKNRPKPADLSGRRAKKGARAPERVDAGLDGRKTSILGTVVYEYIATGEPVGSAMLTQKYNLGISPATVRHEMATLEEEGYLDQPHTSAGRVPSDLGYRYYVDRLMLPEALSSDERDQIHAEIRRASRQLDSAVAHASHVLSNLTRNIAFAMAPRLNGQSLRHLELIWVAPKTVHIVLVTNLGLAGQATVEIPDDVDQDRLTAASKNFNEHLAGTNLSEIAIARLSTVSRQTPLPDPLLRAIAALLTAPQDVGVERRLFTDGTNNLLDQQEFRDLRKLRGILELMDEQRTLYELLRQSLSSDGARVSIGKELGEGGLDECSVVTIPYRVGEQNAGAVGVLGPRRMHYARLIALVNCMADSLNAMFQGERSA